MSKVLSMNKDFTLENKNNKVLVHIFWGFSDVQRTIE